MNTPPFLVMIRIPLRVFWNSYSPMTCSFKSLWSRMRFVVDVITIGGHLPDFLGASCSRSAFCAPVDSVSMSAVLRGAKTLRVNTTFGGGLTAADVGTGLVDFLAVYEVSLETCLLRLFISWKSSPGVVDSNEVLLTASLYPACALIFRTAFSLFSVTVHMP
jgi:hypothetical protein